MKNIPQNQTQFKHFWKNVHLVTVAYLKKSCIHRTSYQFKNILKAPTVISSILLPPFYMQFILLYVFEAMGGTFINDITYIQT
jgi:hypothetical protein